MAGGAEIADKDIFFAQASFEELGAVGFAKIEQDAGRRGLMAGGQLIEPLDGIGLIAGAEFVEIVLGIGEFGGEGGSDFGADLVAAAANSGAKSCEEVLRLGTELHAHATCGFLDDASQGAAPTGVNCGDSMLFGVDEEDGNAIGGLYAKEEAGMICGGGIATIGIGTIGIGTIGIGTTGLGGRCFENADDVGMELFERNEMHLAGAQDGLKTAAIFEDVFAVVPIGETQVENFLVMKNADPAGTRAEAMHKPGKRV